MVTIRLTRRGAKNQPFYHVVVTDSRKRQGGSSLELVGYFNPVARGKERRLKLDLERIEHWREPGAQAVRARAAAWSNSIARSAATPPASGAGRRRLSRYLVLGRIVAPHGVRGALRVRSYADPPEALLHYRRWLLRRPDREAEPPRGAGACSRHTGMGTRCACRSPGSTIATPPSSCGAARSWSSAPQLPPTGPREYYREDLLGFAVRNGAGALLGELLAFLEAPAGALMVVRGRARALAAGVAAVSAARGSRSGARSRSTGRQIFEGVRCASRS